MAAVLLLLVGITLVSSLPLAYPREISANLSHSAPAQDTGPSVTGARLPPGIPVFDGGTVRYSPGNGTVSTLTDQVSTSPGTNHTRSYSVRLSVSVPLPWLLARVTTAPLVWWASPGQFPGGADNLPPASDWTWTVWRGSVNDTSNWSMANGSGALTRTSSWLNTEFRVVGSSLLSVRLSVDTGVPSSGAPTGVGVVLRDPDSGGLLPLNDSDGGDLIAGLHPSLLRISVESAATAANWDSGHGVPRFNFSQFDAAVQLASVVGAGIYLSLPVGTWGDGNILPVGMPLNSSLWVTYHGSMGRFPTPGAYAAYVGAIANHTQKFGARVTYWNVGNEMPLQNGSIVRGFIHLFNVAEQTIHSVAPGALVGSDVMMDPTYLPEFAADARNVGFLSFHYYPALGLCVQNGQYCPPQGSGNGTTDTQLFRSYSDLDHGRFLAPMTAQSRWFNGTGHWLPVIDSESNLNGVGGGMLDGGSGTDPRQQTLFAASWITATLVRASADNVAALTYFDSTSPTTAPQSTTYRFGGWGFGLTTEGTADQDNRFAPYWALALWGQATAGGAASIPVSGDIAGVTRSYSTRSTSTLSVVVVNTVNVPVQVWVNLTGSTVGSPAVRILDQRSYQEFYDPAQGKTLLLTSGVREGSVIAPFVIDGYGVALFTQNLTTAPAEGFPGALSSSSAAILLAVGITVAAGVSSLAVFRMLHGSHPRRRTRRPSVRRGPKDFWTVAQTPGSGEAGSTSRGGNL